MSHPDIFALGDVAETNGAKMARAGMQQAEITQANILALINGAKRLKDYVPSYAEGALKLSLGKVSNLFFIPMKYRVSEAGTMSIALMYTRTRQLFTSRMESETS